MKERVLIAEDSATQRELLQLTLEQAGYQVRLARDGEEALRLALEEAPDVVVTDIVMPVKDGYALCRELKARPGLRDVPVVLLTGLSDPGDIIAGLQCGADGFIGKPFTEDYLLSRLREVLVNRALPDREAPDGSVRVQTAGETYTIHAGRTQILDLLLSVYHAALRRNRELLAAERELLKLNRELERKFKDREQLLERERAAREEAERATRMKEEFLATVSHELRTPLSAITGWVQFLREGQPTQEDLDEALAVIERNAWAQTQIVSDLLDMSRIVSGKLQLEVCEVDLPQVIRAGLETVRTAAEGRGVRLETRLPPHNRPIRGDPARLQQVVWNLLSNAVKFTPSGGTVTVRLATDDSGAEIQVEDTGVGIEPEFLPFVFDRFRQSDASVRRKHGGLGLGLSIVKHLVELHGGMVDVKSEGQGRGACFRVRLPRQPAIAPAPAGEPAATERQDGERATRAEATPARLDGVHVLVVEDERDARRLIERLLGERGAGVRSARSVAEAMEILRTDRVDVIISDVGMPGEDGYDFIGRVRSLSGGKLAAIPALALTAFAGARDRERALEAGFDMYLSKPAEANELVARVAELAQEAARAAAGGSRQD